MKVLRPSEPTQQASAEPSLLSDELPALKQMEKNLRRELEQDKKAAKAGTVYWLLQWLLIFL